MKNIYIASKRRKLENLSKEFPEAEIIDVTSKAEHPWVKFSPFFPHGDIPVPFSNDTFSQSVEGLWQGLKVFDKQDVDVSKFEVVNMKGIKRTVRRFGTVLGHRKGVQGQTLLSYADARTEIYLPSYIYVLENFLKDEVGQLSAILKERDVVLLDYETNTDINDLSKPLSHASIIRDYIMSKL